MNTTPAQASQREPAYRIGLTGNIATGKTTVGKMLVALGAELIDADRVTHEVIAPGGAAYDIVVATFGTRILDREGRIDRPKLGSIVFQDPDALALLEDLIHPRVISEVGRRMAESESSVVVVEAIKLLESGMADDYDAIWVTTCPMEMQLARLMEHRGLSRDAAMQRIEAQPPQAEKIAQADLVIDTSGSLEETRKQVIGAWHELSLPHRGS